MRERSRRGFFLLSETTAAMAIVGIGLLMAGAIVAAAPGAARRVAVQRAALHRLESTLERVRAGELPLRSGEVVGASLAPEGPGAVPATDVKVTLDVKPVSKDLWEVTARASFLSEGRRSERTLRTMMWRPS